MFLKELLEFSENQISINFYIENFEGKIKYGVFLNSVEYYIKFNYFDEFKNFIELNENLIHKCIFIDKFEFIIEKGFYS